MSDEEIVADANENIVEEVVEEDVEVTVTPDESQTNVLLSLEELIKTNIVSIDKLRNELKQVRDMFVDSFNNNPTFREHTERVKEVNKAKASVREQILKQPSVMQLQNKMKGLSAEVKERQASLSDYLLEYQRMTGASEIEVDGEPREIVNSAKVIKVSKR